MSSISSTLSIASSGLNTAGRQMANTSQKIASYGSGAPGSDDLAENMVDLSAEKNAFKANALVLKSSDQMLGTLLDIFDTQK